MKIYVSVDDETTRKLFAAAAMQGLLTHQLTTSKPDLVCKVAVIFADELMKRLEELKP